MKYDFRLSNFISGNLKFGFKKRTKKRSYDQHFEYVSIGSFAAGVGAVDSLVDLLDINHLVTNPLKIPLRGFLDNDYSDDNFFNGQYSFGPVADLEDLKFLYNFFSKNYDRAAVQARYGSEAITADTEVLHHIHQTNSQIYDYNGEEEYSLSLIHI